MYIKNKRDSSKPAYRLAGSRLVSHFIIFASRKIIASKSLTFHILNINYVINEQMNAGFYDLKFSSAGFPSGIFSKI